MKRTTILIDEGLHAEAKHLAGGQGRTFTALVQDALREYIQNHRLPRRISFAGIGESKEPVDQEKLDELLIAGLHRYEGWSPRRSRETDRRGETPSIDEAGRQCRSS